MLGGGFDGEQDRCRFGIHGADVLAGEKDTKHNYFITVQISARFQEPCDGVGEWCQMPRQ